MSDRADPKPPESRRKWILVGKRFGFVCFLFVLDAARGSQSVQNDLSEFVSEPTIYGDTVPLNSETSSAATHGAYDDVSWAVMDDKNVTSPIYKDFMESCARVAGQEFCTSQENWRMQMNMYQTQSVYNYTKTGFMKTRAPHDLFQLLRSFFDRNREELTIEWSEITTFHNNWEAPTRMMRIDNETLDGGGQDLYAITADAIRPLVEEWIGMRVAVTSVYGIRVYGNHSVLAPHVDRLPLVSSIIMNIAQDVDEDWPLEVYDHDGIAHNVTMVPGDIIFYESATVVHGRPFPLRGKVSVHILGGSCIGHIVTTRLTSLLRQFYANIFIHFEPLASLDATEPADSSGLPPYLVPGSSWEPEWKEMYPSGWELLKDPWTLADRGDLYTLKYLAWSDPTQLSRADGQGWTPLFSAIRKGHLNVVKFLIEQGADINAVTGISAYRTPLAVAYEHHGEESSISKYLRIKGAILKPIPESIMSSPRADL